MPNLSQEDRMIKRLREREKMTRIVLIVMLAFLVVASVFWMLLSPEKSNTKEASKCWQFYDEDGTLKNYGTLGYVVDNEKLPDFLKSVREGRVESFLCDTIMPVEEKENIGKIRVVGYVEDTSRHVAIMSIFYNVETELVDSVQTVILPTEKL